METSVTLMSTFSADPYSTGGDIKLLSVKMRAPGAKGLKIATIGYYREHL